MDLTERLTRFFAQRPGIKFAMLYGSFATGRASESSDVDVAVVSNLSTTERFDLSIELMDLTERSVDLVELAEVGQPLLGEVMRDGVIVKPNLEVYWAFMQRNLYDQEDFVPQMIENLKLSAERFANE